MHQVDIHCAFIYEHVIVVQNKMIFVDVGGSQHPNSIRSINDVRR